MKKFAFKTLSILLAAVLLAVAMPIAAFSEDVSPCNDSEHSHAHIYEWCYTEYRYKFYSDEYHITQVYPAEGCVLCGLIRSVDDTFDYDYLESHEFDESVDPEVDMEAVCIYCETTIYW